jgi:hypothetical protein
MPRKSSNKTEDKDPVVLVEDGDTRKDPEVVDNVDKVAFVAAKAIADNVPYIVGEGSGIDLPLDTPEKIREAIAMVQDGRIAFEGAYHEKRKADCLAWLREMLA